MADITLLVDRLQQVALQAKTYHRLDFTYPAVDLSPANCRPHLEEPRDVAYREKPAVDDYRPEPCSLDFFTAIEVQDNATSTTVIDRGESDKLCRAVDQLSKAPGRSKLGVVAFLGEDDVIYRFRLSSSRRTPSGTVESVQDFEMDSAARTNLLSLTKDQTWMQMVRNLTGRASVRAYFHVLHNLLQYDADFAR